MRNSALDTPAPAADRLAATLLRPLDQRSDARLAGRLGTLPPPGGSKNNLHPDEAAAVAALEAMCREDLARDKGDVGAWLDAAERFLFLDWRPRAEAMAQRVLDAAPGHPRALALMSAVRFDQGHAQQGVELANRSMVAAQARGDAVPPYLALLAGARFAAAHGDIDTAASILQGAMDDLPARPEAPFLLGRFLVDRCRYAEALPLLLRSEAHEPDPTGGKHLTAGFARTMVALLQGRPPQWMPPGLPGIELPVSMHGGVAGVPVRLDDGAGGALDGILLVDTGASMVSLSGRAALLASGRGAASARTQTASGPSSAEPRLLAGLTLGPLRVTDVPVLADDVGAAGFGEDVLGVLGITLLRRFHVTLDLPGGRLLLDPPLGPLVLPPRADGEGNMVPQGNAPFEIEGNQMMVHVSFGDEPLRHVVFDTGAVGLYLDDDVLQQRYGLRADDPRWQGNAATGFGGGQARTVGIPLPEPLMFGGIGFAGVTAWVDPVMGAIARSLRSDAVGVMGPLVPGRYAIDFVQQVIHFDLAPPEVGLPGR